MKKGLVSLVRLIYCQSWTTNQKVQVQALARSLCCVLGQDTLLSHLTVPLSTHQGNLIGGGGGAG